MELIPGFAVLFLGITVVFAVSQDHPPEVEEQK